MPWQTEYSESHFASWCTREETDCCTKGFGSFMATTIPYSGWSTHSWVWSKGLSKTTLQTSHPFYVQEQTKKHVWKNILSSLWNNVRWCTIAQRIEMWGRHEATNARRSLQSFRSLFGRGQSIQRQQTQIIRRSLFLKIPESCSHLSILNFSGCNKETNMRQDRISQTKKHLKAERMIYIGWDWNLSAKAFQRSAQISRSIQWQCRQRWLHSCRLWLVRRSVNTAAALVTIVQTER